MPRDRNDPKPTALPWTFATTLDEARAALEPRETSASSRPSWPAASSRDPKVIEARLAEVTEKIRGLVSSGLLSREAFREAVGYLHDELAFVAFLPKELKNALALFLHVHRAYVEEEQRLFLIFTFMLLLGEGTALYEELVIQVVTAGDRLFCDVLARLYLARDEWRPPLGDGLVGALRGLLVDEEIPVLGRGAAALVLGSSGAPLVRAEVAPLLEDDSWAGQLLGMAAMLRAGCLTEEDLVLVLENHFYEGRQEHEDDSLATMCAWFDELRHALAEVGSTNCADLLQELVECGGDGKYLDSSERLGLFAGRFPDRALPEIDRLLGKWEEFSREPALPALKFLPLELAIPRLERMCTDPIPALAKDARELHRERTGRSYGEAPESVMPPGLFSSPPSEKLLRRLAVVRDPELEPRRKLRDLLVAEVNDGDAGPEEAALLALLLCDGQVRWDDEKQKGYCRSFAEWMATLRPHLGSALDRALLALAARFDADASNEPLAFLCSLHEEGELEVEGLAAVRAQLMGRLSGDQQRNRDVLVILERVGVPAEGWERIYDLLGDEDCEYWARHALENGDAGSALDERLERDLDSKLDPELEKRVLLLGLARGASRAEARALERVRTASGAEAVERALPLARVLLEARALKTEELLSELERPGSPRFALGMLAVGRAHSWDARTRSALERALISPHPETAGEVLRLFVNEGLLDPQDPRLPEIIGRVSWDDQRRALLPLLLRDDLDLRPLTAQFVGFLSSAGEHRDSIAPMFLKSALGREILEKAGVRVSAPNWMRE